MLFLPRCAWHGELCATPKTCGHALPGLSWPRVAQWPSHPEPRGTPPPQRRQSRQPVRSLPHAEDRNPGRAWHLRQFAYLQVHFAGDDRKIQDSKSLHLLSYGQIYGLGDERIVDLEDDLSVASRRMTEPANSPMSFNGTLRPECMDQESENHISFCADLGMLDDALLVNFGIPQRPTCSGRE